MAREISYEELVVLDQLFNGEVATRGVTFPSDETREQCLLDFIQQYKDGNDDPHITCCDGVTAEHEHDEIRRCDHCGKPMDKGYYLGGEFACSDECALALYNGDREQMEEDLSHAFENDAECYYTEWEDIYLY